MNKENKALFIFGFVFYFIGDLATTYIALSSGLPESGLIRIITRDDFSIMVLVKVIFFIALYFLIMFLEKRGNNYLCGAILGLVAGMGMTVTWMNALAILEYLG
jgi:hypothetical protein